MQLPSLYAIVDAAAASAHGWTVPDLARAYVAGGARLLQLRAKHVPSAQLLAWCDAIVQIGSASGACLIVNDRADLACLAGAAGVHVGQDDLPVTAARAIVGTHRLVGLSTHTREQIERAAAEPVSYLAVGPIFETSTKETGYRAVGMSLVRYAIAHGGGHPVVAIGGVRLDRIDDLMRAGVASVAVIGDLLAGGNPEARVCAYLKALGARA